MLKKSWAPYLVYGLLSLAILGPLLDRGYILSLDMIFTPRMDFSIQFYGLWEGVTARLPLTMLIQLLSGIMPVWLLEKVIFLAMFFLAGISAHRLIGRSPGSWFAGVFYTVNPFTYVRFISGQWPFLLAYALTPFAIKAFLTMLDEGGWRNILKVALLTTLVGMMFIHSLLLLFLIFLVILVFRLAKQRHDFKQVKSMAASVAASALAFIMLNIYWLVPILTSGTAALQDEIGQADLAAFAPQLDSLFDLLALRGFWNTGYYDVADFIPFWPILFLLLLLVVIYGVFLRSKSGHDNKLLYPIAVSGLLGFILSIGITFDFSSGFYTWLFDNIFFMRGFRDTHKFLALLCLAYAYLGGLGLLAITEELKKTGRKITGVAAKALPPVCLLLMLVYGFPLFGTWGQLQTTDYPTSWYEANDYLNQDEADFNVLFLPWHLYLDFSWLPNNYPRLGNPTWQFFDKPIISGDNIEISSIYSSSGNPVSKYVEFLLQNRQDIDNLGELLAPLNIKYVILAHEVDYQSYDFVAGQPDMIKVFEQEGISIYRNTVATGRIYAVSSRVNINSLEEYLALSRQQDVMQHLYTIDNAADEGTVKSVEFPTYTQVNQVHYEVGATDGEYTIFTLPQRQSPIFWSYNNQPTEYNEYNLGFIPAFNSTSDGGGIKYTKFYSVYLPAYLISCLAWLLLALLLLWRRRRHPS